MPCALGVRIDAGADDRKLLAPEPEGFGRRESARVGGLEEEDVDALAERIIALTALDEREFAARAVEARALVDLRHSAETWAEAVEAVYDEALA